MGVVTIDEDGPLLRIGVDRPEASNLWDLEAIQTVSRVPAARGRPAAARRRRLRTRQALHCGARRLPARLGAAGMRYLLTAERFDAAAALRLCLVTEVVPAGTQLERALELARVVAGNSGGIPRAPRAGVSRRARLRVA